MIQNKPEIESLKLKTSSTTNLKMSPIEENQNYKQFVKQRTNKI